MTQEMADKIFETPLGSQVNVIYVTSDDQPFIDYQEAVSHISYMIDTMGFDFDDTITTWYPSDGVPKAIIENRDISRD